MLFCGTAPLYVLGRLTPAVMQQQMLEAPSNAGRARIPCVGLIIKTNNYYVQYSLNISIGFIILQLIEHST